MRLLTWNCPTGLFTLLIARRLLLCSARMMMFSKHTPQVARIPSWMEQQMQQPIVLTNKNPVMKKSTGGTRAHGTHGTQLTTGQGMYQYSIY
ncbi:unnamed protein product, partial [Chrysoparadoxa australica]